MRVLFFGDIVSESGRNILKEYLPILKEKYDAKIVIANGENVTHGKGISKTHYEYLLDCNVDVITLGNHFLASREDKNFFENDRLIRPLNIHQEAWGVGSRVFNIAGFKFRVTNLLGRIFISELAPENPFNALDELIEESQDMIHIVDFHAEASAEKIAFGYYFDGRVSAVIGTHTHVQTADEKILPNGTAYITDVGMCGPYNSVIGTNIDDSIFRVRTGLPVRHEIAKGEPELGAIFMDIDDTTFKCKEIKRIRVTPLFKHL